MQQGHGILLLLLPVM